MSSNQYTSHMHYCKICNSWISGDYNWARHEQEQKHQKNVQRMKQEMKEKSDYEEKLQKELVRMRRKAEASSSADSFMLYQESAVSSGRIGFSGPSAPFVPETEEEKQKRREEEAIHKAVQERFALPSGWSAHTDNTSGQTYYFNELTKKSQWERPMLSAEELKEKEEQKEKEELEKELKEKNEQEKLKEQKIEALLEAEGITVEKKESIDDSSKKKSKKLLLEEEMAKFEEEMRNYDPKNRYGKWVVTDGPSELIKRSEELKKRDKERELQAAQREEKERRRVEAAMQSGFSYGEGMSGGDEGEDIDEEEAGIIRRGLDDVSKFHSTLKEIKQSRMNNEDIGTSLSDGSQSLLLAGVSNKKDLRLLEQLPTELLNLEMPRKRKREEESEKEAFEADIANKEKNVNDSGVKENKKIRLHKSNSTPVEKKISFSLKKVK
ncbi:putative WW domain [Monocercomonoides exilis]|uniref:putative WW domain n=1 Tax=Monocercomonoides exilis TaxID=2049356 RepID=UPI00355AC217|nr:putative WW domain [Monocercomonoides exilis]